jgi:hypothetical protein
MLDKEPKTSRAGKATLKDSFTTVPNSFFRCNKLSTDARYLLMYLNSFSSTWKFHDEVILKDLDWGVTKLKSIFKELREHGYVKTITISAERGRFGGKERLFHWEPIYFLENQKDCKNENLTDSLKKRGSGITEGMENRPSVTEGMENRPSVKRTLYNNNNSNNNKHNNNNTNTAPRLLEFGESTCVTVDKSVVVSLEDVGIKTKQAIELAKRGKEMVDKILLASLDAKVLNRQSWIVSALRDNYTLEKAPNNSPVSFSAENPCDALKKIQDDLKRLNDPEMRAKSDAARKQNLPRLKRML